jgi:hypothetical protein
MILRKHKKYYHGGTTHPTWEERKAKMLESGNWKEGPDGSLLRVSPEEYAQTAYEESSRQARQETLDASREEALQREGFFSSGQSLGLPDSQYMQLLQEKPMDQWTDQDYRDWAMYAHDPSNPISRAFQVASAFHPVYAAGEAAALAPVLKYSGIGPLFEGLSAFGRELAPSIGRVLGDVVGTGSSAAVRAANASNPSLTGAGARTAMRFMPSLSDELAESVDAGFGSIRPIYGRSYNELRALGPKSMERGLEESNRMLAERMGEFFSEEGQRRARQQIIDQVEYYKEIAGASDEYLKRLGFDEAQIKTFRKDVSRMNTSDQFIDSQLAAFNARMRSLGNRSGEVVNRAEMQEKTETALMFLKQRRRDAYDKGDYQAVSDLDDMIHQTLQAEHTRDKLIEDELTNAFYQSGDPSISLGREYLVEPEYSRVASAHEIQHALQDIPLKPAYLSDKAPQTVEADRILEDLLLIDKQNPAIKAGPNDYVWDDLAYFQQQQAGRLSERSPFLSELREDMLDKGYISHRYQEVDDDIMDRYLKDYYGRLGSEMRSTEPGNTGVRILEIMDDNTGPYNRGVLKDAINKMLVGVPAVGAGAAALSSDENQYGKGGKFKLRKAKKCGCSVRKK